jgi:hypothetical protein
MNAVLASNLLCSSPCCQTLWMLVLQSVSNQHSLSWAVLARRAPSTFALAIMQIGSWSMGRIGAGSPKNACAHLFARYESIKTSSERYAKRQEADQFQVRSQPRPHASRVGDVWIARIRISGSSPKCMMQVQLWRPPGEQNSSLSPEQALLHIPCSWHRISRSTQLVLPQGVQQSHMFAR